MNEDADMQWHDVESMPIGRLVAVAGTMIGERWRRAMDEGGFDQGEAVVLLALPEEDADLSHREVARRCWMSPANITSIADRLEKNDFIERVRDVEDRRVVRLRITEAGRRRRAETADAIRERFAARLPAPSAADEEVVRRYLAQVIRRLSGAKDHAQEGTATEEGVGSGNQ